MTHHTAAWLSRANRRRTRGVFAVVAILAAAFWAFSPFQATDLVIANPPGQSAAQAPSFDLSVSYPTTQQEVGGSFYIQARIHNVRGTGERGGLSFSFPQIADGGRGGTSSSFVADGDRRYQGDYISSAADIVFLTTGGMGVFVYRKGESIENPTLPEMTARHLLIESDGIDWDSFSDRIMQLQVTPKRAGEFRFGVRAWVCADGYQNCEREPSPGSPRDEWQDQQGMSARFGSVAVAPAPEEDPPSLFAALIVIAVIAAVVWWLSRD